MSDFQQKIHFTVDDVRKAVGLRPLSEIYEETGVIPHWSNNDGELDFKYARTEVREREDGVSELVVYIPFAVKGL